MEAILYAILAIVVLAIVAYGLKVYIIDSEKPVAKASVPQKSSNVVQMHGVVGQPKVVEKKPVLTVSLGSKVRFKSRDIDDRLKDRKSLEGFVEKVSGNKITVKPKWCGWTIVVSPDQIEEVK